MCTATQHFVGGFKQASGPMGGLALEFQYGVPTRTRTRAVQVKFFDAAVALVDHYRAGVVAAGVPAEPGGATKVATVKTSLAQLETGLERLDRQAHALPVGHGRAAPDTLLAHQVVNLLHKWSAYIHAHGSAPSTTQTSQPHPICPGVSTSN
jgi:hypothetical protein